MTRLVTIVMYHYIRDQHPLPGGRGKDLVVRGRAPAEFRFQLRFFKKYYNPITMSELLFALADSSYRLPPNPILLTFDDGYLDHWETAAPILLEEKVQGSFFSVGSVVIERKILDVNKIHFVLAAQKDRQALIRDIFSQISENRDSYALPEDEELRAAFLGHAHRFDNPDDGLIKYALQRGLPQKLRSEICTALFSRYVTQDIRDFTDTLYMSPDHLRSLQDNGMYMGGHGWMHLWLDTLPFEDQEREITQTARFLASLGVARDSWVMAYPYGASNVQTRQILQDQKWAAGITTQAAKADLNRDNRFLLPRLDTNDFPLSD